MCDGGPHMATLALSQWQKVTSWHDSVWFGLLTARVKCEVVNSLIGKFWFEIIWICDLDRRIKDVFSRSFGVKPPCQDFNWESFSSSKAPHQQLTHGVCRGDLIATGSNDKTVKLMNFNPSTATLEGLRTLLGILWTDCDLWQIRQDLWLATCDRLDNVICDLWLATCDPLGNVIYFQVLRATWPCTMEL